MKVFITDTTLREGMQSPLLELDYEKRRELFHLLASVGVAEIEAGVPAHSEEERKYLKELIQGPEGDKVIVWNRANPKDLEFSFECGARRLEVAFPISDIMIEKKLGKGRSYVMELLEELLPHVKSKGVYLSVGLEDGSRADRDFLLSFAKRAKELGADRVRLSDTVGVLNPIKVRELVKELSSFVEVEVHFHNDFGMATANSVIAVLSGAKYVNASLLGVGERCGITPTEEVVYYLEFVEGIETGIDLKGLYQVIERFVALTGIEAPKNKPIVGENAFTNKSSIHLDAMSKSRETYLPFDPKEIGREERVCMGLYSRGNT